jgi:hypothetical protein
MALPVPELCRWLIKAAGPSHKIFHAAGRKQRAIGLEPMNSKVFRIGNDAFAPKLRRLSRLGLEANRTDTRHRSECPGTLLGALSFVKVGDAFFRDDVRRLAYEAADSGLLSPELAAGSLFLLIRAVLKESRKRLRVAVFMWTFSSIMQDSV